MFWRLAVLGSPITHSLSPRLFEAALSTLGMVGSAEAVDVDLDHMGRVHDLFRTHDAVSITMPLKAAVVERCDRLDAIARRVGVVNSIRIRDGHAHGRLTDGVGLLDALLADFAMEVATRHVVVFGSGSTARTVVDALTEAGAAVISLVARNEIAAQSIAERYPLVTVNPADFGPVDLQVNTVPFAAGVNEIRPTIPEQFVDGAVAIDVVYNPVETPWLEGQRLAGLRTANGISMLVHQAHRQFEWWFEQPVDIEALFKAVRR